jgi:hypothetical protein
MGANRVEVCILMDTLFISDSKNNIPVRYTEDGYYRAKPRKHLNPTPSPSPSLNDDSFVERSVDGSSCRVVAAYFKAKYEIDVWTDVSESRARKRERDRPPTTIEED